MWQRLTASDLTPQGAARLFRLLFPAPIEPGPEAALICDLDRISTNCPVGGHWFAADVGQDWQWRPPVSKTVSTPPRQAIWPNPEVNDAFVLARPSGAMGIRWRGMDSHLVPDMPRS
ncbi:hypothetical protein [Rhodopirellula sallentina]|uniref:Uncharacterized protein n=1 Tax=Rhodopirellula sallentina SM41 TaxID=1263870 RepID=M5UIT4_9BACT|nr:hypothetical protein [Rhodopirellula sallentina]EMI55943.1 hypothetical protein RSSM_02617 [Rhodopirellula sallentina SM41]